MSFLIWIIVGGLAGWVASKVMNTDASMGLLANIIVGIIGSLIGGTLYSLLTSGNFSLTNAINGFDLGGFVLAVVGAIILLWIVKMFSGSRAVA